MTDVINVMPDKAQTAVKTAAKSAPKDSYKNTKSKDFTSALDKAKDETQNNADNKTAIKKTDAGKPNTDKSGQSAQKETVQRDSVKQVKKNSTDKQAAIGEDEQSAKTNVANVYSINVLNTMLNVAENKNVVSTKKTSLLAILQQNVSTDDVANIITKANNSTDKKINVSSVTEKTILNSVKTPASNNLATPQINGQLNNAVLLTAKQNNQLTAVNANADSITDVSVPQNKAGKNADLLTMLAAKTNNLTANVNNLTANANNLTANANMQDTAVSQNKITQGQLAQLLQEFAGQMAETKSAAPKIAQSDAEKGKIVNTINSTNTTALNKSSNATILSVKNVDDAVLKQINESAAQQENANQSNDGNDENNVSFAAQLTKADSAAQVLTNGVQSNAQPQQSQNAYDIGGQIIRNAQLLKGNENSQMVINLQPEHLGELAVKINVHSDGMVSASFHSDNAQVRNVIQASIVQLRQDLQDQGIKVDNINVYSGLSDLLSNGQNNNGSEFTGDQKKSQYRIQQLMDATGQMEESGIVDNITSQQNNADDGIDYRI